MDKINASNQDSGLRIDTCSSCNALCNLDQDNLCRACEQKVVNRLIEWLTTTDFTRHDLDI